LTISSPKWCAREDLKAAERDELVKKHGYKIMDYHE
jgi:GDPmannose 4,6-dehydratase